MRFELECSCGHENRWGSNEFDGSETKHVECDRCDSMYVFTLTKLRG
jgi:hypothetical protein